MTLVYKQVSFFAIIKNGLWRDWQSEIMNDGTPDWVKLYKLVQSQAIQGIFLQGLEKLKVQKDVFVIPQALLLQLIGEVQMIEQRNKAMNAFIASLVEKLRRENIYVILIKGQGVAQCYERPLWRTCGDVDLLVSEYNFERAKGILTSIAENVETEDEKRRHLGMTISGWSVELHGTLHGGIRRINHVIDEVQNEVLSGGYVRSWQNGNTNVFLPRADEDVFFVFTHILQHFYFEGIGLRQICDWCRLLYCFRDSLNHGLLEKRIRKAGIMTEWKAFGYLAVLCLGMPAGAMPFYESSKVLEFKKYKRKADRILKLVMESGNFGHNRDVSYKQKYPFVIRYAMSLWLYTKLAIQWFAISPRNAILAWWAIVKMGANAAAKAI